MSTILKGIAASSGIAIGKAYRLVEPICLSEKQLSQMPTEEIIRFHTAIDAAKADLQDIRDKAAVDLRRG